MSRLIPKRPVTWALLILLFVLIILARRWVHHAQLELMPVIVPDDVSAASVVHPPAGMILSRMLLDVHDAVSPPTWPRLAVLTFDDGPFPVTTPLLMAQLKALQVPGAFFLIGRDAQVQLAISKRIVDEGLEIGNHTLTHPELTLLPYAGQQQEIGNGAQAIAAVTGTAPKYFRPPHGNFNADTIVAARSQHQTVALWDIDPGDWRTVSATEIARNVEEHGRSPAVILLHNGKLATLEALPHIVAAYRAAGFTFVSLDELQRRLPLSAINDPIKTAIPVQ